MSKRTSIKKLIAFFIVVCTMATIVFCCMPAVIVSASVTVPTTPIKLYCLPSYYANDVPPIPSNYPTSYQIQYTWAASNYTFTVLDLPIVNGYSRSKGIEVSSTGLVTIANVGSAEYPMYSCGVFTVNVYDNSTRTNTTIDIELENYYNTYIHEQIQQIADELNATCSTDYERIYAATKYVAENFSYGSGSSMEYMIIHGTGTCYGSTDTICHILDAMGVDAWWRRGFEGASDHANVVAYAADTGKYYQCEAGYVGTAPRYFYVSERNSIYDYTFSDYSAGEIILTQYNAKDVPVNYTIPSTVNGYTVVGIADNFLIVNSYSSKHHINISDVQTITVPNTVRDIGNFAFAYCDSLTTVNIPASVNSIGRAITAASPNVTNINIDSNNSSYTSNGSVIYSKDMTTLVSATNVSSINIPSTVTTIADYAFYRNSNITVINVPSTVTHCGDRAFSFCEELTNVNFAGSGLQSLGASVFAESYNIRILIFPASLTSIEPTTFYSNYSNMDRFNIMFEGNAPAVSGEVIPASSGIDVFISNSATGFDSNWGNSSVRITRSANPYQTMIGNVYSEYGYYEYGWMSYWGLWYYRDWFGYRNLVGWQQIDGSWYYFTSPSGAMMTGWLNDGGNWYYLKKSGVMSTGWQQIDSQWYYFSPNGIMQRGWQQIDGKWYFFKPSGAMATGWYQDGGKWYYFGSNGIMRTDWQNVNGHWYYFGSSGSMKTGWVNFDGSWYYFSPNGIMQTEWQNIDGTYYYFGGNGIMRTGWQEINGRWYYLNGSGKMLTEWQNIGGKWFYFGTNGIMKIGWVNIDGSWYYFSSNGIMQTGWQNINGNYYYFGGSGVMQSDTWVGNYHLNASGIWDYSR